MSSEKWNQIIGPLREELLVSIEAITHTGRMLLEKTSDTELAVPDQVRLDLVQITDSSRALYYFIKKNAELPQSSDVDDAEEFEEQLSQLRHDIRNQLNAILGPCQFIMMNELPHESSAQREFQELLAEDVENIQYYVSNSLSRLQELAQPVNEIEVSLGNEIQKISVQQPIEIRDRSIEPAHVLIVDDSELNREMLARFMKQMGHTCDFAVDGQQALDRIRTHDYDLVLLDIQMPVKNGLEVLQSLNDQEMLRRMPVLVVSGLDSGDKIISCIELGAEDFLTRPINMTLLRARVNACLEKKRLREREFGQFFPPEVARQVALRPEILDEGREADVSVLFCDIRGFSRISEKLEPEKVVRWIRDVMEVLSECVLENQGVLVDYIGDELVAMWGAPTEQPDHAQQACSAARAMIERLPAVSQKWFDELKVPTHVGIGLNSGKAHVGNTGTARRRKYGPLGNTVNLASRVQGATRYFQTDLLVTAATHAKLEPGTFHSRRLCTVKVNNIEAPVALYEILPDAKPGWEQLNDRYESALLAFESRQFREAASMLGNLLLEHTTDGPSLLLMSRVVNELIDDQPRGDFDPVWPLPGK